MYLLVINNNGAWVTLCVELNGGARPCWWCEGNASDLKIVLGFSSIAYGSCVKDWSFGPLNGWGVRPTVLRNIVA